jgi:hypothetical protein
MNATTRKAPHAMLPWTALLGALTVTGVATAVGSYQLLPRFVGQTDDVRHAVVRTAAVVIVATVVGLMPLVVVALRGSSNVFAGWLVGSMVRMAACLVAAIVLVKGTGAPALAVLGTLTVMYLPLLAVEAVIVTMALARPTTDDANRTGSHTR